MPKNCLTQINFWKGIASQRWNIHLLICSDLFQFIILMLTSAPHLASACIQSQQRPASPCSRCKGFSEHISTADMMEGTESYQTTAAAWSYSNQCLWANSFMLGNAFQEMAQPCSPLSSFIIASWPTVPKRAVQGWIAPSEHTLAESNILSLWSSPARARQSSCSPTRSLWRIHHHSHKGNPFTFPCVAQSCPSSSRSPTMALNCLEPPTLPGSNCYSELTFQRMPLHSLICVEFARVFCLLLPLPQSPHWWMQLADDLSIINSFIFLNKYRLVLWLCGYFIQPAVQRARSDRSNHHFICLAAAYSSEKARRRGQHPHLAVYSSGSLILNASQEAASHHSAADGGNKEKTFWLLSSYLRSTALQNC